MSRNKGCCPSIDTTSSHASALPVQNGKKSRSELHCHDVAHLSLALFHVNLIAKNDEGEILGVMRTCLDQELVSPAVQSLKRLQAVHVVDQYATVCATVEGHTERLEAFLTGGVP